MEGRLLLLCAVFGLWLVEASEDVASSKVIADTNKDLGENPHEAKNASYFVNPKRFLTYVDQIDKIKSLGDEVHCKLHGSCSEKKNKVAKKINSKASKKSIASRPRDRMPDNHNNVLSPEALMNPVAGGILGGNEYTQQPEDTLITVKRSISSASNNTRDQKNSSATEKGAPLDIKAQNNSSIVNIHNKTLTPSKRNVTVTPGYAQNLTFSEISQDRKSDVPFYRRRNANAMKRGETSTPSAVNDQNELSPIYVTLEDRKQGRTLVVRPLERNMQTFLKGKVNAIQSPNNEIFRRGEIAKGTIASNSSSKSNIAYASVPVINLDPAGQISRWLKYAQDSLQKRDFPKGTDSYSPSMHIQPIITGISEKHQYIPSASKSGERFSEKSNIESSEHFLGRSGRVQSPDDVKSEIEYPSSQEEISARQIAENEPREQDENDDEDEEAYDRAYQSVENIRSGMQRPSDSFDFRTAAAESSSIQGMRENSFAYGNRKREHPMVFEREVGFGPISVEAKTADAPPDSASED